MEENVALNGNWKATHVFYTNSRTRWHECALYIMQRPPFKRVCAPTHARSCKPRKFKLQFCALHLSCHYSFRLIFSFSFSLRRFEHFSYYLLATIFFFIFPSPRFFVLLLFTVLFLSFFIIPWTRSNFAIRLSLVFLREQRKLCF